MRHNDLLLKMGLYLLNLDWWENFNDKVKEYNDITEEMYIFA